jgi:hypothetical protein
MALRWKFSLPFGYIAMANETMGVGMGVLVEIYNINIAIYCKQLQT